MKLKIISLSLLIIAILLSCRKENLVIAEETDVPLLSKVQITLNSYTYDSNGYPLRKNGTVEYLYE